ncbi:MDR family MFS transporter [Chloroflexota bacterium]
MEVLTSSGQPRSIPRRQVVITMAGVMLALFLSSLDQTIVGTAMPRIISDLGGFSHYTWLTTAYIITSAVAIPITGKLTDMYGRKYFYIGGLVIFTIASFLCGFSATMIQIIVCRGIQGIGAGIMMANAFTVIGDFFPPAERGKYQGLTSGVFGISSIIGPTLGGIITDTLSWHWIFFINVPLGIIIIILFIVYFPYVRPDKLKHQIDYPGVLVLVLCVVPLMLAISWAGVVYPWISQQIIGMLAFSVVMVGTFLFIESRSKEPIIPLSLFRNQIVRMALLVIFLTSFGMFGSIIFVPLFFQGVLGATATTSGSFLTPMMLGVVFGSLTSGQILSRTGGHYRLQGAVGISILALGLALLSTMTAGVSYVIAVAYIVITGIGLGITIPVFTITVQNAVPQNILGVATSATAFFRSIGGAVGLAIMGSVMNNRFTSELISGFPPPIKTIMPRQQLEALAHNPQALISPEAQIQLKNLLEQLGLQDSAIFEQALQALRQALSSALSEVFFISFGAVLVALVIYVFIREIPLRKHNVLPRKAGPSH